MPLSAGKGGRWWGSRTRDVDLFALFLLSSLSFLLLLLFLVTMLLLLLFLVIYKKGLHTDVPALWQFDSD